MSDFIKKFIRIGNKPASSRFDTPHAGWLRSSLIVALNLVSCSAAAGISVRFAGPGVVLVFMASGVLAGVMLAPVVLIIFRTRPLLPGLVGLYGPTLMAAAIASLFRTPIISYLAPMIIFLFALIAVVVTLPPLPRYPAHCCQSCGYDLSGAEHEVCPECGAKSPRRNGRLIEPDDNGSVLRPTENDEVLHEHPR